MEGLGSGLKGLGIKVGVSGFRVTAWALGLRGVGGLVTSRAASSGLEVCSVEDERGSASGLYGGKFLRSALKGVLPCIV